MADYMDFAEVLQGEIFTFNVGEARRPYKIHASIVSRHSKPLEAMMYNGLMKESINKSVTMACVEPTTFVQFAEFCYSGNYRTTTKVMTESYNLASRLIAEGVLDHFCYYCGQGYLGVFENPHFPRCAPECKSNSTFCIVCGRCHSVRSSDDRICQGCATTCLLVIRPNPNQALWDDFKKEEFGAMGMSHRELRDYLQHQKTDEPSDDLIDHARLWVFAECYDIPALRRLSLHKLHRDLIMFDLSERNCDELVSLLEYVADNTMGLQDAEGGCPAGECTLRSLLLRYTICHTNILRGAESFGKWLENGGSLVKDYVQKLMQVSQIQ